jgi:hypothetical protein
MLYSGLKNALLQKALIKITMLYLNKNALMSLPSGSIIKISFNFTGWITASTNRA